MQNPFPRHTRSFFTPQVNRQNKQISNGRKHQVVMKASPGTPLEMIQPQVILGTLEVLLDVPAGAAQFQAVRGSEKEQHVWQF